MIKALPGTMLLNIQFMARSLGCPFSSSIGSEAEANRPVEARPPIGGGSIDSLPKPRKKRPSYGASNARPFDGALRIRLHRPRGRRLARAPLFHESNGQNDHQNGLIFPWPARPLPGPAGGGSRDGRR